MHVSVLTEWGSPAFYDVFEEVLNITINTICFGLVGATKVRSAVVAMAEHFFRRGLKWRDGVAAFVAPINQARPMLWTDRRER